MKILSIALIGAALVMSGCVAAKETHAGLPANANQFYGRYQSPWQDEIAPRQSIELTSIAWARAVARIWARARSIPRVPATWPTRRLSRASEAPIANSNSENIV